MRKVFESSMVAHVWAQQSQPSGRNGGGSFFFEGDKLYSYGSHFCVGRIVNGRALLNSRSYSISTSRHQSYARQAVRNILAYCPHPEGNARANRPWFEEQIQAHIDAMNAMRPGEKVRREKRTAAAAGIAAQFNDYLAALPESERGDTQPFDLDMTKYAETLARMREIEARAKAKAEASARRKAAATVRKWLAGDSKVTLHWYRDASGSALLRVNGDVVETSLGAQAPLEHVRRALALYDRVMSAGMEWASDETDSGRIRLGHFTLDAINADGSVRAGCHFITAAAIAHFRTRLGGQS